MTTPQELGVKAALAAATAVAAAATTTHNVRKDNVNEKTGSIPHAEALGNVAQKTGKFEEGLNSLKSTNAETAAFDAFEGAAGIPAGTITSQQRTDPISSIARNLLGTEGVEVKTPPGVLANLQQQRESELAISSPRPKISTGAFEDISAPEAQVPSDSAEQGQLVPPTGSTGTGGPSNFASLSHARYGRRSEFTQLISPTPEERPIVSSSPPLFVTFGQVGLIILTGVTGFFLTWYGLKFFSKPSK